MRQCLDDVDKVLPDEHAFIPLDYVEEDRITADGELKIVEDLLTFSQSLLQEIHTTKSQRETNSKRSKAWIPNTQASK